MVLFTGLVSFSVLSIIPATKQKLARARNSFVAPLRSKGVVSSIVGGALLGMGLTLSGTVSVSLFDVQSHCHYIDTLFSIPFIMQCPGMVFVQLGGGVPNAGNNALL